MPPGRVVIVFTRKYAYKQMLLSGHGRSCTERGWWRSWCSFGAKCCCHFKQTGIRHVEEISEEGQQSAEHKEVWKRLSLRINTCMSRFCPFEQMLDIITLWCIIYSFIYLFTIIILHMVYTEPKAYFLNDKITRKKLKTKQCSCWASTFFLFVRILFVCFVHRHFSFC